MGKRPPQTRRPVSNVPTTEGAAAAGVLSSVVVCVAQVDGGNSGPGGKGGGSGSEAVQSQKDLGVPW